LAKVLRIQWSSPSNITFRGKEEVLIEDLGFSDEEWDDLGPTARNAAIDEAIMETLVNLVEIDGEVIDE